MPDCSTPLREWRLQAADGKPAYTAAHNRTLELIAAARPESTDQLAQIKGVGPTFLERHEAQMLALVGDALARAVHR
jgi:ATP-dependent DNA helicase RecQ